MHIRRMKQAWLYGRAALALGLSATALATVLLAASPAGAMKPTESKAPAKVPTMSDCIFEVKRQSLPLPTQIPNPPVFTNSGHAEELLP